MRAIRCSRMRAQCVGSGILLSPQIAIEILCEIGASVTEAGDKRALVRL